MRVSSHWLRECVDFDVSSSELAEMLTMAGLEVEGVEQVGLNLERVVVGQIVSISPHPQADRLFLCRVREGEEVFPIVCGARNMREGDKVALALVGAELPQGGSIKRAKIRGEISEGMMCSEAELGLSDSSEGIMILPPEAPVGVPLMDFLDLRDHILEISLTPNRGDCLSIIGVAREVAALTGGAFHPPTPKLQEGDEPVEDFVRVSVLDPDLCSRYSARLITGVQIGPSPFWLRTRLEHAGMRSINNVVDVTNYVMLEYGQPLHAFDFDRVERGEIVVKRADEGEIFLPLDGVERVLDKDTLMICDAVRAVAIGGIMGGSNSEIQPDTSRVLLESAYFSPTGIRRTSKVLGLQTESSFRFERGVDPEGVLAASVRATSLICELTKGKVAKGVIDVYPSPLARSEISLRLAKVNALLGMRLKREPVKGILRRLGMEVKENGGKEWVVSPPTYRSDVTREIDLIEEIGRVKGYDLIPVETPRIWILPFRKRKEEVLEERIKELLVGLGFYEVITYSFISPQSVRTLRLPKDDLRLQPLTLLNPLTEEESVMRTTLLPGLLETARYNLNYKTRDLRIFELKQVYYPKEGERLPEERRSLAGLVMGTVAGGAWNTPAKEVDFYDVKGCVEGLLLELKIPSATFTPGEAITYLHPSKAAVVRLQREEVGVLGELHPEVADAYELPSGIYVFELDFRCLLDHLRSDITFMSLPKFPSIARDVAVVVNEEVNAEEIAEVIRGIDNRFMESVYVFDCYRSEPIPPGKKGLAFRISYRSPERTLTDEEVNVFREEVVKRLREVPRLTIR